MCCVRSMSARCFPFPEQATFRDRRGLALARLQSSRKAARHRSSHQSAGLAGAGENTRHSVENWVRGFKADAG